MTKTHKGKWLKLGINKSKRRKIYEGLRIRANTILRQHHKREYKKIMKNLIKIQIKEEGIQLEFILED